MLGAGPQCGPGDPVTVTTQWCSPHMGHGGGCFPSAGTCLIIWVPAPRLAAHACTHIMSNNPSLID